MTSCEERMKFVSDRRKFSPCIGLEISFTLDCCEGVKCQVFRKSSRHSHPAVLESRMTKTAAGTEVSGASGAHTFCSGHQLLKVTPGDLLVAAVRMTTSALPWSVSGRAGPSSWSSGNVRHSWPEPKWALAVPSSFGVPRQSPGQFCPLGCQLSVLCSGTKFSLSGEAQSWQRRVEKWEGEILAEG